MAEDNEALLEKGFKLATSLQKARDDDDKDAILAVLNKLKSFPMTVSILKKTNLGLKMHEIRKEFPLASEIRNKWMADFQGKKPPAKDNRNANGKRTREEEERKSERKKKLQREAKKVAENLTPAERSNITGRAFMRKLEVQLGKQEGYFDKEKSFIKDIGAVALQMAQKNA